MTDIEVATGYVDQLIDRWMQRAMTAEAEVERLRALVYAQNEVITAVRSLRQRGGENPSRGVWPALHEVFDALDSLDREKP